MDDFDDFVDPYQLYACCLGPEPLRYVLEKIHREEKSKILSVLNLSISLLSLTLSLLLLTLSIFLIPSITCLASIALYLFSFFFSFKKKKNRNGN